MTATLLTGTAASISQRTSPRVTQLRVALSEWTKFRSLRSTLYTLLLAVVLMIGLGALLLGGVAANQTQGFDAGNTAISTSLTGTFFAQLSIGVLGVLLVTGEYSTGMIRASPTVVPARLPVLWAKLAVCTVAVLPEMERFGVAMIHQVGIDTVLERMTPRPTTDSSSANPSAQVSG